MIVSKPNRRISIALVRTNSAMLMLMAMVMPSTPYFIALPDGDDANNQSSDAEDDVCDSLRGHLRIGCGHVGPISRRSDAMISPRQTVWRFAYKTRLRSESFGLEP